MKKTNKSANPTPPSGGLQGAEVWKPIPDFPRYEVSNMGRVRSNCCKNGHKAKFIIKPSLRSHGYYYVRLFYIDTETGKVKIKQVGVHRLVARAFIGECPPGKVCDHKSGDRLDNRVENLRYASRSENRRSTHTEQFKDGFRIEIFCDGKFLVEVTSRKALLQAIGNKIHQEKGGFSLNSLFRNGRTWRYKNYYAVLVLPSDDVEPGPAPHVQFRLEI